MTFGLTVAAEWWQWLLMVLGAGFCWHFGGGLGGWLAGRLTAGRPSKP